MKKYYELIINGNLQEVLGKQTDLCIIITCIEKFKEDGRIKDTDDIKIRTTIVIEEDFWFKR